MSDNIVKKLSFGSRQIVYELSFAKRKTLGIRVHPDCSVQVIAPVGAKMENVLEKVRSKAPWILKQQNEFLSYHPLTPARKYINGETHFYLGRQYKLRVESSVNKGVMLSRGRIVILTKDSKDAKLLLNEWYKEKSIRYFRQSLNAILPLFRKYKIGEPELHVLRMKTRWGSCTSKGKIILNPELIKAPRGCIDYVITHELCHLVHHNHTKAFYDLQDRIMPDWKKWKLRLETTLN